MLLRPGSPPAPTRTAATRRTRGQRGMRLEALAVGGAAFLPVLGATALVTIAARYQVRFFWVGLAFNLAGIAYLVPKVVQASKEHARCAVLA